MPTIFKSGSAAGRAKPGHKSIRGTISAPIPIPSPDEDEFPFRNLGPTKPPTTADDEFPMRSPGTGIASPLPPPDEPGSSSEEPLGQSDERGVGHGNGVGKEGDQEQGSVPAPVSAGSLGSAGGSHKDVAVETRPEPSSTPPAAPPAGAATPVQRPASRAQSGSSPHRSSTRRNSPPRISPPARRATNPVLSTVRYSIASESPSKQTSQSKDAPQRKKSTLRTALGKLFRRNKKQPSNGSEVAHLGSSQHQSDPTALARPNQRSPHRSGSVPISEFDLPLRSHSIGPDDIMAIESARNSLHADAVAGTGASGSGPGGRRRAATAGGRMLVRPHLRGQEWGAGLSPRPASAQGRGSRLGARDEPEDDPNEIGRAITSDSGHGLRRRSQSMSGLQDLAGVRRRRSDEIRYWRESYDPGFMSPISSNVQTDIDDTGGPDPSVPESPAAERPAKTPLQPFNFDLLSKEMMGMKITHAADIDTRLADLESRTTRVERAMAFRGTFNFKDPIIHPSVAGRSSISDTNSRDSIVEHPTLLTPANLAPATAARPARPTSKSSSTLRGAASLPLLNRDASSGNGELAAVVAQLRADLEDERAARQALEAQVKKLSERLNTLSTTMFAMVRGPSEARSSERLAGAGAGGGGGGAGNSSPLLRSQASVMSIGAAAERRAEMMSAVPPPPGSAVGLRFGHGRAQVQQGQLQQQQQASVFETDDDEEDEEENEDEEEGKKKKKKKAGERPSLSSSSSSSSSSTSSASSPVLRKESAAEEEGDDDFHTPREVKAPGVAARGAFGEELRPDEDEDEGRGRGDDDDPKRKKAARTLSLSQLTMIRKGRRSGGV